MAGQAYERRLSGEEAAESFIFIIKKVLDQFPAVGNKFDLIFEDSSYEACIVAVSCDCVGTPHEHYHLKADELFARNDLEKGTYVTLFKTDDADYLLKVKSNKEPEK